MKRLRCAGAVTLVAVSITILLTLSGCSPKVQPEPIPPLTIGVHPIVDALPFLVAQDRGYFEAEGLDVTIEFYNSGLDRDGALQADQADGAMADVVTTILLNKSVPVDIVSIVAGVTPEEGRFAILASPESGIEKPEDLRGVPIGISPNTVIEFTTDMLLEAAGVDADDVEKTMILDIPLRLQLLMSGELQAANLPDPMAALAEKQGARVILDDTQGDNYSQSVLTFTERAVKEKGESIRRMLRAYARAVQDIQSDPEQFRELLETELRLPAGLTEYSIGPFSLPQVPTEDEIQLVVAWMLEKGNLKEPVSYAELVNDDFLPER